MKAAILEALKGSHSQNPVRADDLIDLGVPGEVRSELESLFDNGDVNRAQITRKGISHYYYWLTGIINPPVHGHFRDKPRLSDAEAGKKRAEVAKHLKTINDKEKDMPRITTPAAPIKADAKPVKTDKAPRHRSSGALSIDLLGQIIATPGISRVALVKFAAEKHPEATKSQFDKAIWDMVNTSKTVCFTGPASNRFYSATDKAQAHLDHLTTPVQKIIKPAKPEKPAKPVGCASRTTVHEMHPTDTALPSPVHPADTFNLMLSDENHLHLTVGDDVIMLKPDQTARLHTFLNRISLVGGV